ncbi:hypothetical protein BDP81DRAFT_468921, partial [Colletotrichum phormii]
MGSPNEVEQTSHTCGVCPRSFTRIENFKRHQKTHQGNLPHHCIICQKRFSRSDFLKKHQRLHQKLNQENASRGEHKISSPKKVDYSFIMEDPNPLSSLSRGKDRETEAANPPLVGDLQLQYSDVGRAMNITRSNTSYAASSVLLPSGVAFSRSQDTMVTA